MAASGAASSVAAAAAAIFATGLVGGFVPILSRRSTWLSEETKTRLLGVGSAFGGGFFLAAGYCHLLADAQRMLPGPYPFAMLASALGTLLTFSVELAADVLLFRQAKCSSRLTPDAIVVPLQRDTVGQEAMITCPTVSHDDATARALAVASGDRVTAIVTFVALSFHSLLAGIAAGTDDAFFSATVIAILAHKGIAALALSTTFLRLRVGAPPQPVPTGTLLLWATAFALITPTGVGIGAALGGAVEGAVVGAVNGLASGTFTYIGLVDIARKEIAPEVPDLGLRVFALSAGFGAMSLLAVWV